MWVCTRGWPRNLAKQPRGLSLLAGHQVASATSSLNPKPEARGGSCWQARACLVLSCAEGG